MNHLDVISQTNVELESGWINHLKTRGLSEHFKYYYLDYEKEAVTFPIWSPTGFLAGYQRYTWKEEKARCNGGRYFTWISEPYKQVAFWGFEYACGEGPLFIVESIWNAARLINHGRPVIATLGATPHKQMQQMIKLLWPARERIVICDNDENKAGDAMKKLGHRWFKTETGDLNDMTHEEVGRFLEEKEI